MLKLTLTHPLSHGLDIGSFFTDALPKVKTLAQLQAFRLCYGTQRLKMAELFKISGRLSNNIQLNLGKAGANISHLGKGLPAPYRLTIHGNAGDYLAAGLAGGTITLKGGNAGNYAASQMAAGSLTINGNAGDFVAAASKGAPEGMTGGVVLINGNAGNFGAFRMRRGTVIVQGNSGANLAAFMKGGTVIVQGKTTGAVGSFIKRGTLFLLGAKNLYGGWQDCGMAELAFFGLLANNLPTACLNNHRILRRFTHHKAECYLRAPN